MRKKLLFHLRVLNNGVATDEINMPCRRSDVYLSQDNSKIIVGSIRKNLDALRLVRLEKNRAEIFQPPKAKVLVIGSQSDCENRKFQINAGETAVILCGQYRVLVKIREASLASSINDSRPKLVNDGNQIRDFLSFGTGWGVSLFLLSCAILALLERPNTRPQSIRDLGSGHLLLFTSPKTLETAPEALKFRVNRTNPFPQIVSLYTDIARIIVGTPSAIDSVFGLELSSYWQEKANQTGMEIAKLIKERQQLDNHLSIDDKQKKIIVPSIYGASLQERVISGFERLIKYRRGLVEALAMRRDITAKFPLDPRYDWTGNGSERVEPARNKALEKLGKISILGQARNEEEMYQSFYNLAEIASTLQNNYRKHLSAAVWLTRQTMFGLYLPANISYVSFLTDWELPTDQTSQ